MLHTRLRGRAAAQRVIMAFLVQAEIVGHTVSATTETAKEAFEKAIEWRVVHKLSRVTISVGVQLFSITDFASAMTFLEFANTVGAASHRRPEANERCLMSQIIPPYDVQNDKFVETPLPLQEVELCEQLKLHSNLLADWTLA